MPSKPGSPSTRERILAYLEEHHTASVGLLSRVLRLTPANIRYHLGVLMDEGLVERVSRDQSQPIKRGRPAPLFCLTTTAVPDNFPLLCSALLHVILAETSTAEIDQKLQAVAAQMAGPELPGALASTRPVQRLNKSVAFFTGHGYRARWEASPSGPRVLFRGCPYAAIIDQHPELCRLDRFLLESLSGLGFQQTARLNPKIGDPPACIFSALPAETGARGNL